jgi:gluconate kinase
MNPVFPLANWIPYRLKYDEGAWLLNWLHLDKKRMTEPFFDETISICRSKQKELSRFESCSDTTLLIDAGNAITHLKPTAIVFHVSRCGSTLLSQAFAQSETCISIAEAPLLDEILRATEIDPDISDSQREAWFKAALNMMGQIRTGKESAYVIKLDSWHIHFYNLLREWFPEVPFFFLTRQPDEIIASHAKRRGVHMVPGLISPALLKIDSMPPFDGDFNAFGAEVLKQYYLELQVILNLGNRFNRFFDYSRGVKGMLASFSGFTGIELEEQMYERLKFHSKSAGLAFSTDAESEGLSTKDSREAYQQLNLLLF